MNKNCTGLPNDSFNLKSPFVFFFALALALALVLMNHECCLRVFVCHISFSHCVSSRGCRCARFLLVAYTSFKLRMHGCIKECLAVVWARFPSHPSASLSRTKHSISIYQLINFHPVAVVFSHIPQFALCSLLWP